MAQNEAEPMDTTDDSVTHQPFAGSSAEGLPTAPVIQAQPQPISSPPVKWTNVMVQEFLNPQDSAAPMKTTEKVDLHTEDEPKMLMPSAPPLPTYDVQEDLYTADDPQDSAAPMKTTEKVDLLTEDEPKMLMPSAPPLPTSDDQGRTPKEETEGEVNAIVECQWKEEEKSKKVLQIALQSWFNTNRNKDFKHKSCTVQSFSSDGLALIKIKPASAIEALLQLGGTELTTKDGKTATIKFYSKQVPKPGTPTPDSHLMDALSTLPPGTHYVKIPMEGKSGGAVTAEQETKTCHIPLGLFWYINQVYREKMKRIERENGVHIKPDVNVSIEVDPKAGTSDPSKAKREFEDLVQSGLNVYDSRPFRLENVDPADWTATLNTLRREEAMVVLTASSGECTVWGPSRSLTALPKSLTIPQNTAGNADIFPSASGWGSPDTSQKIDLNIQDPLVSSGITMDEIHWKLMTSSFDEKMDNIQDKFGVKFEQEISQGRVKVRVKSTNGVEAAALESHALGALLRIYQKVATSSMSCSLVAPDQAKEVEDKLKEIRSQYPVIGTGENYDSWRLIGLPENLGPAVNELEKLVGPVFKAEDKQRIGYPRYNMPSVEATSMGEGTSVGGATGENSDENCPICMDTFTNKEKLKCGHEFCKKCLKSSRDSMGDICPVCKAVFGKVEGNQPNGTMSWTFTYSRLPGFKDCGTITIDYSIPGGKQTEKHPKPGKSYNGIQRTAYLPDNKEGNEVLKLLKRAFDQKLIFTVGISRTTGADDVVTWNDIHHKTCTHGGPISFGYPDPSYLSRVKEELKARGIE